jgi:serine/threonine protein kinase
MLQLAKSVLYLHSRCPPIMHRDIKPDNILLRSDWSLAMTDFGGSRVLTNGKASSMVGSPVWMCPERIQGHAYDTAADIYSLGVVLWQLATGDVPFSNVPGSKFYLWNRVVAGERPCVSGHPAFADAPPGLDTLITSCWHSIPAQRVSAADTVACLEALLLLQSEPTLETQKHEV